MPDVKAPPPELEWVTHWSDLLDQDQFWRDGKGQLLRIQDMEQDYCGRVYAFMLRRAEAVIEYTLYSMTLGPGPSGEVATDGFNREFDMLDHAGDDPQAWMAQTDLAVALKRRAEGLPPNQGICFCGYPFAEGWDHGACHPDIIVD